MDSFLKQPFFVFSNLFRPSRKFHTHSLPQSGFTILEVLIASLLVGVGIFSMMETFNRGYFGLGEVERYSLALSLTQEKMEELKDTSFGSITNVSKAALDSPYNTFSQEVQVDNPAATTIKTITVITYWTVPNGETNISLATKIANTT